jgi:hypothetical protein
VNVVDFQKNTNYHIFTAIHDIILIQNGNKVQMCSDACSGAFVAMKCKMRTNISIATNIARYDV